MFAAVQQTEYMYNPESLEYMYSPESLESLFVGPQHKLFCLLQVFRL